MTAISKWLESLGLQEYADQFAANRIGFDILSDINDADLKNLNIPIGDRKRILKAIQLLHATPFQQTATSKLHDIATAGPDNLGERRQLTMLFADLVGSTSLSEHFNLEDYRSIITAYCECCANIVQANGGFLVQYQGDGVLAYFGYPKAAEDDAERAVIAGLAIISAVPKLKTICQTGLNVRVGIATGVVLVGDLLSEHAARTSQATGETPNLAARLQAIAMPGSLLVNTKTRNLLGRRFVCQDAGQYQLKGFSEPVQVWKVQGSQQVTSRFDDHQRGNLTPFIDREEETELLQRRWDSTKAACGQTVLISGEPGIGKSRLAKVLCDQIASEPHTRLRYQCLPNQQGSPLHPFITQLEFVMGFNASDHETEKFNKLESWARQELSETPHAIQVLAKLLSIPINNHYKPLELSPKEFKDAIFKLMFNQLTNYQNNTPVILIFEDLQWIDPTSQEFLDALVDQVNKWRLFLVCTCRPQYTAQWIGDPSVTYLSLRRLDNQQAKILLDKISEGIALPAKMTSEILTKTDGVPLFLEELTKSVLESGTLQREGHTYTLQPDSNALEVLPTTLLGSLLARLDRIPGAQKVAPLGAAIGRTFSYELLHKITDFNEEELQSILSRLINAQLLSQHGHPPDATYKFKHALMQEAAYETMPKGKRCLVHKRIATTLNKNFPVIAAYKPETLAYHYAHANAAEEACEFWRKAAVLARERSANIEAIAHIRNALNANDKIENASTRLSNEIELREMLYVPLEVVSWGSAEISENFYKLRKLRKARGDTEELLLVIHANCSDHIIGGRVSEARTLAQKIQYSASDGQTNIAAVLGHRCLGFCDFLSANFHEAVSHFKKTITLAKRTDQDEIKKYYYANIVLVARVMIAWSLVLANDQKEARKAIQLVTRLTDDETDIHSKTYALSILASIHQSAGNPDKSLQSASQALALSQEYGSRYWEAWSQIMKGWALTRRGAHNQGIGELREGIEKYANTSSRQMLPYARTLLADAYCCADHISEGMNIIEELEKAQKHSEIRYVTILIAQTSSRLSASLKKSISKQLPV